MWLIRRLLYAADLVIWLWTILFKGESCYVYNIGSEEDMTITELANTVAKSFEKPVEVIVAKTPDLSRPADRYVPATKRAQVNLGLRQIVNLGEAIQRTLHHIQTHRTLYFCNLHET